MQGYKRFGHVALALYIAFVFIQSLFFKFTGSPETIYIFESKLDPWAASLGFPGLFAPGGLFSAQVVGSAELLASVVLLAGTFVARWRVLQGLGALLGLGVISGAIFFHLFTPLGVAVINTDGSSDGGQLFIMACGVWIACAILIWKRRAVLLGLIGRNPAVQGAI
ncbi:hypothetical protein E4T66_20215 [Sinimarinibacterium sp. CAU 1509]|uniref:hypothetical protein n=1 Tax=Sinimarinibacterium sp. CAU 1509 TaxID=2562283 RepID=UPI0010AD7FC0|nr:hypothetical protein [Sinimarinibacterium sp. CAU 1509]TJY55916.1 hypothetical protein E4T66_20215 [Sinimarinibacterium sp. CAU 1509]